jgi:Kef-type K+ transport system membrane component KefB
VAVAGMHVDLTVMRRRPATVARITTAGLLVPFGLGVGTGFLLPGALRGPGVSPLVFALFLGVALGVSAIPVIAKTLMDMNMIHRNVGQLILASGALTDAVGWILLSIVSALSTARQGIAALFPALGGLLVILLATATIGRYVVHTQLRWAHRTGDGTAPVLLAVTLIVLASAGAAALGMEPVLGAFLCGILLRSCQGVDQAWAAPIRTGLVSVLAPLFFALAGLRIDLGELAEPAVAIAAVVIVLLAVFGKFAGAWIGAVTSGLNRWEAVALGAGMNARGVVEIVIASIGVSLGVLTSASYTIVVIVAVLTSVMAPPILRTAIRRIELTSEETIRAHEQSGLTLGSRLDPEASQGR